jgi:hypothetical protein
LHERRPPALAGIGVQSELGDGENRAPCIEDRTIHSALVVREDAQRRDLVREPARVALPVPDRDPEEHQQAGSDLADDLSVDPYACARDALEECSHLTAGSGADLTASTGDGTIAS